MKDRRFELLWQTRKTSSGVPLIVALDKSTTLGLLSPSSFASNAIIAHAFAMESTGMKTCLATSMIGFKRIQNFGAAWNWKMKGGRRFKQLKNRQIGMLLTGLPLKKTLRLSAKRHKIGERESESENEKGIECKSERYRGTRRRNDS